MRIRTIKPEYFTHEGIFDLEKSSGLPIRAAFPGLWCAADRKGRFKWEPRRLGVAILPYDLIDFSRVLDALLTRGFVVKYRVAGVDFGWIPSFERHQVINNREKDSDLPECPSILDSDATGTRGPRVIDACQGEGNGREHGKEGNGKEPLSLPPPAEQPGERANEIAETSRTGFTEFWQAYPRKKNMGEASRAWQTMHCAPIREIIMAKLAKLIPSEEWTRDRGKWIPKPDGWLSAMGWMDEPVGSAPPANGKPKEDPEGWREWLSELKPPREYQPHQYALPHLKTEFKKHRP